MPRSGGIGAECVVAKGKINVWVVLQLATDAAFRLLLPVESVHF